MKIMTNVEYHDHPAISKSGLDQIAKSPAHYQLYLASEQKKTAALEFGSAFHTWLLEPERIETDIVVVEASDRKTNIYKNAVEANPGKTLILAKEKIILEGMKESFEKNQTVNRVLTNALIERSLFWTDPGTGVECRCRPDIIFGGDILIDLKSTECVSKYARKDVFEYRADVQAAMYMTGYEAVTGIKPKEFLFITVEKTAPFGIVTYRATPALIERGLKLMRRDLETYARCLATDTWPSYSEDIQDLSLPDWAV